MDQENYSKINSTVKETGKINSFFTRVGRYWNSLDLLRVGFQEKAAGK
jgi:hypothetical protein